VKWPDLKNKNSPIQEPKLGSPLFVIGTRIWGGDQVPIKSREKQNNRGFLRWEGGPLSGNQLLHLTKVSVVQQKPNITLGQPPKPVPPLHGGVDSGRLPKTLNSRQNLLDRPELSPKQNTGQLGTPTHQDRGQNGKAPLWAGGEPFKRAVSAPKRGKIHSIPKTVREVLSPYGIRGVAQGPFCAR